MRIFHRAAFSAVFQLRKDDFTADDRIRVIALGRSRRKMADRFGDLLDRDDLEAVYVCSFIKLVKHGVSSLEGLFGFIEELSERTGADFVFEINTDDECPDFMRKYL